MDLFQALPALRHHPLLNDKKAVLIGVSAIVRDDEAHYFEISKPKYWKQHEDGTTTLGVGGIGGSIKQNETITTCLRREVQEEIGTQVRLEPVHETALICEWQIADTFSLKPSKKRPTPLMVILTPPRLGGPDTPDHLAILAFRTRLRGQPAPHDLFGLLRIENDALVEFFGRDKWPLEEAQALPGLTATLNDQPPQNAILRPVLTARAFQLLIQKSGFC
ncbi:MAG: NUDIX domain-containing protein [Anaerolineae bacterium]|nr:NUDIX domain-containing protein [Anaerolineae bacterium]